MKPEGKSTALTKSPWVVTLTIALLTFGSLLSSPAPAADRQVDVQIEAGTLQDALNRLADLTGLQFLYDPPLLAGRIAPALHGKMTSREAPEKLLGPNDIAFQFTASDAVALHPRSRAALQPDAASVPIGARPQTVTISADREVARGYNSTLSFTATRIDANPLTVPFSTASLTREALKDQQAQRLDDVLEYVSGVETAPNGQSAVGFSIRGFPTYQYYIDGVRVTPDLNHDGFRDLANVASIELVKGPASTLYGRTEPGGLINIITKQPLSDPYLSVEQQAGNFGRFRTQIDVGGPLSKDGLLYRVNVAYETGKSYRDPESNRRLFLAPIVTWNISESTASTFYLEYLDSHDPNDSGLPIIGNHLPPVAASETLEDGGEVHTSDVRAGVRGRHAFANGWTEHHYLDARRVSTPQTPQLILSQDGIATAACEPTSCPVARRVLAVPVASGTDYSGSLDFSRDFAFWHTRHALMLGLDFVRSAQHFQLESAAAPGYDIDLFQPRHGPVPTNLLLQGSRIDGSTNEQWGGIYFQDQVAIGTRLTLLGGARGDIVSDGRDGSGIHENALTGRGGLTWRLTSTLSAYINFSEGFGIDSGLYILGPHNTYTSGASSRSWETGLKIESPDGRAGAAATWFDLTKHEQGSPVQLPLFATYPTVVGAYRNKGLELDIHGALFPGLQVIASGAYNDSRIIGASSPDYPLPIPGAEVIGASGNRLFGVPRLGGGFWATYQPPCGRLENLKVGLGAIARGEREGDNANDYQLPSFVRWNGVAAYRWSTGHTRWSVQLNVENLFDARYFESVSGTYTVLPGSPRRWTLSTRAEF